MGDRLHWNPPRLAGILGLPAGSDASVVIIRAPEIVTVMIATPALRNAGHHVAGGWCRTRRERMHRRGGRRRCRRRDGPQRGGRRWLSRRRRRFGWWRHKGLGCRLRRDPVRTLDDAAVTASASASHQPDGGRCDPCHPCWSHHLDSLLQSQQRQTNYGARPFRDLGTRGEGRVPGPLLRRAYPASPR